MLRISVRNTLAHKVRFALTTLAVVLGVGFVVGAFCVTDSLSKSVDGLLSDISAGVDVSVRAETAFTGAGMSGGMGRGRIAPSLVSTVQHVEGVKAAEGTASGYAQLLDRHGKPLTTLGAPFIGVSWGHVPELVPATIDSGRRPVGRDEVAIDRGSAKDYGFTVGDTATVLLADGTNPRMRIVGIFTFGESNNLLGARLTAFDSDVARDIFGTNGQYDTIDVVAKPGVDPNVLVQRIQAQLPTGVEAVSGDTIVDENKDAVSGMLSTFQNVMLGFAGVSLFVSAFFINNTLSIVVGQRVRELALLRAIAATPGQVTRSVLAEGLFVGLFASVLGIGFGVLISKALLAILRAAGQDLPQSGTVLLPRTLVAAFVVGIGVTALASLTPARRAAAVPPVDGMREGFVPTMWSRPRRLASGLVSLGGGACLVYAGLYLVDKTMTVVMVLAVGAVGVFLGVSQLSPLVGLPIVGTLGAPLARLFRVAGKLAHSDAVRNRDRTSKSASALMIGLALVTTVFIVGTSMKQTFAASMNESVSADFVLTTGNLGITGFSPVVTERIAALPEVAAISGVRMDRLKFEGKTRDVVAVDPDAAARVVDIKMVAGSLAALDEHSIVIHADPARDHQLNVGDTATVQLVSGAPQQLTVAGIYSDSTNVGNYMVSMSLFAKFYPTNNLDLMAFARLVDGADPDLARRHIEEILTDYPQVQLDDRSEFAAAQQAQFDSLLVAINGLLGLALFIALLGIANTLALSVLERTREIGLLRAVGMLQRQAWEMIVAESAMVAVFGAVLGIAVGTVFGLVVATALPSSVITAIAIPFRTLGVVVMVAALCGIIAGLLPARRASHLDVLQAIASQ